MHAEIDVPDGDTFVHSGDFTTLGQVAEVKAFGKWLAALPHERKIVITGNHDFLLEEDPSTATRCLGPSVDYLFDSGIEIDGISFWRSPWTAWFHDWAFNLQRGKVLREKWSRIPERVDVLVTHRPPYSILNRTKNKSNEGNDALRDRVNDNLTEALPLLQLTVPHHPKILREASLCHVGTSRTLGVLSLTAAGGNLLGDHC